MQSCRKDTATSTKRAKEQKPESWQGNRAMNLRPKGHWDMPKHLWISTLLFGAAFAQPIMADTYDVTLFDGATTTVDGTGVFTFSAGTFSAFSVSWDTFTFNFTATANAEAAQAHGCDGGGSISFFTYLMSSDCQSGGSFAPDAWGGESVTLNQFNFALDSNPVSQVALGSTNRVNQFGTFSVTDTSTSAVPEPRPVFLMLPVLLAAAFVARKRNALGLSARPLD
jgi:hypothetical protein